MNMSIGVLVLTLAVGLSPAALVYADGQEFLGRVDHILDPGTVRIAHEKGGQIRVRVLSMGGNTLAGSSEAEMEQLLGRRIRIQAVEWDDGYLLGHVHVEGQARAIGVDAEL